jgi:hypothetical protein
MRAMILIAAGFAALLLAGTQSTKADSWTRSWVGPHGVARSTTVTCGYYGCGYAHHATGPAGKSWSRYGAVAYGPYRGYSYRAVRGPAGNAYVVRRTWWRY